MVRVDPRQLADAVLDRQVLILVVSERRTEQPPKRRIIIMVIARSRDLYLRVQANHAVLLEEVFELVLELGIQVLVDDVRIDALTVQVVVLLGELGQFVDGLAIDFVQ